MFKRGQVVQDEQGNIGVILWDTCPDCDYASLCWLTDNLNPERVEARLEVELTAAANPERYAFEAALALGDTATALRLYREAQEGEDAAQGALDAVMQQLGEKTQQLRSIEANARRLQASINVIGNHLSVSTDSQVKELTGEKPYFTPGILTAVQFLVEANTTLKAALEPFAAYGRLKLRYPANAVFTIAYDREGHEVILLFEDFTRAAELLPNAVGRTSKATAMGGAGGIAEIAEVSK